jgi:hypothetical protein
MPDPTREEPPRLRLVPDGIGPAAAAFRCDRFARNVEIHPRRRRWTDRPEAAARLRRAAEAIDSQSRRIEDLVRELGVLGRFGEESDGPRAA